MTKLEVLLNVDEVAHLTGWRPSTIRRKVWLRELPYVKLGRSVRFKESEIKALIEIESFPVLAHSSGA